MSKVPIATPSQDTPKADAAPAANTIPVVESPAQPANEVPPSQPEKTVDEKPIEPSLEQEETPNQKPQDEVKTEKQTEQVEVKYELKSPENFSQDELKAVIDFAKENKLSNEQAQKILDREIALSETFNDKQKKVLEERQAAWLTQAMNDPEIGGEKVNENVELSKRVLQKFGTPELNKVLDDTKLGNYPELVRVFARIGRAMEPGKLIIPNSTNETPTSAAKLIYGS